MPSSPVSHAPAPHAPPSRETRRIEAFSDAIFGFAATLLVVTLDVPRTYAALIDNLSGFIAFGISFAALVLVWQVHSRLFQDYPLEDRQTVVLNAVLLFVVLFYVHPLRFLATGLVAFVTGGRLAGVMRVALGELGNLFAIYGLGWAALFTCVALLYRHAARTAPSLGLDALAAFDAVTRARHYGLYVLVGIFSAVVALVGYGTWFGLPGLVYGLLGPLCAWNGVVRRRARASLERLTTTVGTAVTAAA